MLPERILLIDHHAPLVRAWRDAFEDLERFEIVEGDYFATPADAMVSPANSFAIMDGGLDLAIRGELGLEVQRRAQKLIVERHHGELPIGAAEIVPTDHERWPFLVVAPTMRVPESIAGTLNAYHAFRAVLLAIARWNLTETPIRSVIVPGLGTGIGRLDERRCALHMRMAWKQVSGPARIPSFSQIHQVHDALRTG
jgi:O-acetyl-ADP-ribose deacetylase (regulator of RNase III)